MADVVFSMKGHMGELWIEDGGVEYQGAPVLLLCCDSGGVTVHMLLMPHESKRLADALSQWVRAHESCLAP